MSRLRRSACRPPDCCRSCSRKGSRSCASPICHPVRRHRRVISSRGSARRCPNCESSSGAGDRRRWATRARRCCGMLGRISWPRRCWRPGHTWPGSWRSRAFPCRRQASCTLRKSAGHFQLTNASRSSLGAEELVDVRLFSSAQTVVCVCSMLYWPGGFVNAVCYWT